MGATKNANDEDEILEVLSSEESVNSKLFRGWGEASKTQSSLDTWKVR
jgi:hypothetical protein